MTVTSNVALDHIHAVSLPAHARGIRTTAPKVGRFALHFLEMAVAMMVGMGALNVLDGLISDYGRYAMLFRFGTRPFDLAMGVFMTVPMVVWMAVRHHQRRHSAEMAFAMIAPVVLIVALREFGAEPYLPWLEYAGHIVMLPAMLYRRDHYVGKGGHGAHADH